MLNTDWKAIGAFVLRSKDEVAAGRKVAQAANKQRRRRKEGGPVMCEGEERAAAVLL
jgi:hypothetical protein